MLRWILASVFFIFMGVTLQADTGGALVVATCGTLLQPYSAGSTRSLTVDTNGLVCQ